MPILAKALPIVIVALFVYLAIVGAQWLYARYPTKTQRDRLIFIGIIAIAALIAFSL
ncbi:MAG: hypothetical protein KIH69_015570 [Anaerolineae bacterium]|nr:hypothetical protein [Anaerolineae bacterium]